MTTLPLDFGIASTNEATIQPTAGSTPAVKVPIPQPQPRQVTKMATTRTIAISGTGD
jgi:hypothetical protein